MGASQKLIITAIILNLAFAIMMAVIATNLTDVNQVDLVIDELSSVIGTQDETVPMNITEYKSEGDATLGSSFLEGLVNLAMFITNIGGLILGYMIIAPINIISGGEGATIIERIITLGIGMFVAIFNIYLFYELYLIFVTKKNK